MTIFTIKVSGRKLEVFQDKDDIGESEDFKEVLAFIAYTIDREDIKDYKLYVIEKNVKQRLEDFDYEVHLKEAKKYKFDEDDDEDNDDDDSRNRRRRRFGDDDNDREVERKPKQFYTSSLKNEDYMKLGMSFSDVFESIKS